MRRRPVALAALVVAIGTSAAACATTAPPGSSSTSSASRSAPDAAGAATSVATAAGASATSGAGSASTPPGTTSTAAKCQSLAASLPLEQQVGQLYMMGLDGARLSQTDAARVHDLALGAVLILSNPPSGAPATLTLSKQVVQASADSRVPVIVSVDQEGGAVQRLTGEGFSTIPNATIQGRWPADDLTAAWISYGSELAKAGVRYNLAPDADVVAPSALTTNAPVGKLHRNYGTSAAAVGADVAAVLKGLSYSKVAASAKHFPGLGAVTTNTDFGAATDTTTSASAPSIGSFKAAIAAGVPSVMISSAVYTRIDPKNPGVFSVTIITDLLRAKLGYGGVVISDDLGAAASVGGTPAAQRGTKFLVAGGDLVVDATAATVGDMVANTLAKARADQAFAASVTQKTARVLALKAAIGLVNCGG